MYVNLHRLPVMMTLTQCALLCKATFEFHLTKLVAAPGVLKVYWYDRNKLILTMLSKPGIFAEGSLKIQQKQTEH